MVTKSSSSDSSQATEGNAKPKSAPKVKAATFAFVRPNIAFRLRLPGLGEDGIGRIGRFSNGWRPIVTVSESWLIEALRYECNNFVRADGRIGRSPEIKEIDSDIDHETATMAKLARASRSIDTFIENFKAVWDMTKDINGAAPAENRDSDLSRVEGLTL